MKNEFPITAEGQKQIDVILKYVRDDLTGGPHFKLALENLFFQGVNAGIEHAIKNFKS